MILSALAVRLGQARAAIAVLAASLALAGTSPAVADERAEAGNAQSREDLFHTAAWKLTLGNAPFCANTWPSIGLRLSENDGAITVLSVAPDSPAEKAGLRAGFAVLDLDGMPDENPAQRAMEVVLDELGVLAITWQDENGAEQNAKITAESVCPSRFLTRKGKKIGADGVNVRFGLEFPGFDYVEDEFAAAVAHELAHNLMGHPYWLDREGRKRTNIRLTEREADRLMPWLLANAGYDPSAARHFMERWGPKHGGGLFRKRTHDGWDERAELINAEVVLIQKLSDDGHAADWRKHFRREEGL